MLLSRRFHRGAAWLALIAIWLEVAVVFPHVCPDDVAGQLGRPGGGAEIFSGAPDAPDLPLCPLSEGLGGGSCVIYATGHLAGVSLLPEGIKLERTDRSGLRVAGRKSQLDLSPVPHLLFQTRAPPVI